MDGQKDRQLSCSLHGGIVTTAAHRAVRQGLGTGAGWGPAPQEPRSNIHHWSPNTKCLQPHVQPSQSHTVVSAHLPAPTGWGGGAWGGKSRAPKAHPPQTCCPKSQPCSGCDTCMPLVSAPQPLTLMLLCHQGSYKHCQTQEATLLPGSLWTSAVGRTGSGMSQSHQGTKGAQACFTRSKMTCWQPQSTGGREPRCLGLTSSSFLPVIPCCLYMQGAEAEQDPPGKTLLAPGFLQSYTRAQAELGCPPHPQSWDAWGL